MKKLPVCNTIRTMALVGASLAVMGAAAANAQQALAAGPAAQSSDQGLQEIVVTAQRRSQSLSDVGVSVSTVGGDDLLAKGINSTADLQRAIPGFTAADSSLNVPVYSIRGIGLNDSSLASNSTVAIAVNEVPLPYTAMTQGTVLDLQRVEVLKGPQGTLYGQNSTGGAINYIANGPTRDLAAGLQVGYGRFNTFTSEGFVSGPLSETVRVRLAASTIQGGDWQRSYTRDDTLGETHKVVGRASLNWTPTDRLDIDVIGSGWIDRSDTAANQASAFRAQNAANIPRVPEVFTAPLAPANARAADWTPGQDYSRDDRFFQVALKAKWEVAGDVNLTSVSAYSRYKTAAYVDRDGIVARNFQSPLRGDIKSRYQELRLSGTTSGLTWSFGGNYRNDDVYDYQQTDISQATNNFVGPYRIQRVDVIAFQKVETWAAFADGEYKISHDLSVVGGVRYTKDTRDFHGCSGDPGDNTVVPIYILISGGQRTARGLAPLPASAFQAGQCLTLSADTFEPGFVYGKLAEDNVSFHGGLNYKPNSRSLLYASFARGYKSGSFPTLGATFAIGYGPARQERVDAWEAGVKTTLAGNTLRINGAAFLYNYRDKQLRGRIADAFLGSLSKLTNIPKSQIYGAELEGVWAPVQGLTIAAAATYIHTEIKEFVGIDLFSRTVDFSGQRLNYTPKWSVNVSPEYSWRLESGGRLFAGGDLVYRSSASGFLGNDPDLHIDAYTTLDLHAGFETADKRWRATVWGNNVTNKYYWNSVNRGTDTIIRIAAKPVTYGVSVGFKY